MAVFARLSAPADDDLCSLAQYLQRLQTLSTGNPHFCGGDRPRRNRRFFYIGNLVIIGWVVDFLSGIGVPKFRAKPVPLEYEQVGEIIVVKLRDNIATLGQCQTVQSQLKHLVAEHHSDFVLDFAGTGMSPEVSAGSCCDLRRRHAERPKSLANRTCPLPCLAVNYSRCSTTGEERSRKCPGMADTDGLCSVRFPWESSGLRGDVSDAAGLPHTLNRANFPS